MKLALSVGRRTVPAALLPENVVDIGIGLVVHPRAEINKPLRAFDQCGQDIRGQRIDCEDMRETVLGEEVLLALTDRGIVNHRVEATKLVDSFRDRLGPCNGVKVALDYSLGSG